MATDRDAVFSEIGGPRSETKELCLAVGNGKTIPEDKKDIRVLQDIRSEGRIFCWASVTLDQEVHDALLQDDTVEWPEATSWFYLWSGVESWSLATMRRVVLQWRPQHLSLHFDGFMVDEECDQAHPDLSEKCVAALQSETEHNIKLVKKEKQVALDLIKVNPNTAEAYFSSNC